MAIALDVYTAKSSTTGTTFSFNHTCTGSNLVLFIGVNLGSSSDVVTAVTYNSVACTKLNGRNPTTSVGFTYLYYLLAPSTGTHSVTITTSSSQVITGESISYTGVRQIGVPDSSTTNTGSGGLTCTTTTVLDNCWLLMQATSGSGAISAGAGTTLRGTGTNSNLLDSNGAKTPPGSFSLIESAAGTQEGYMISFASTPQAFTATLAVGTFIRTGYAATLNKLKTLIAATAQFLMTGYSATLSGKFWQNLTKHVTSWTNQSK